MESLGPVQACTRIAVPFTCIRGLSVRLPYCVLVLYRYRICDGPMSRLRNLTAYHTKFMVPENWGPSCRVGLSDPLKK